MNLLVPYQDEYYCYKQLKRKKQNNGFNPKSIITILILLSLVSLLIIFG